MNTVLLVIIITHLLSFATGAFIIYLLYNE